MNSVNVIAVYNPSKTNVVTFAEKYGLLAFGNKYEDFLKL